jgi:hypothetical protein
MESFPSSVIPREIWKLGITPNDIIKWSGWVALVRSQP